MKVRFLALVALVLGLASCQKDTEGFDVAVNGEVSTTVTVNLADASDTRASGGADYTSSAASGLENLGDGNYTIRYILQVFDDSGDTSKDMVVKYSTAKEEAFDVRLVPGRHYQFVAWADIVKKEANDNYVAHYTIGNTLQEITLKDGDWNAMDETRDAFTGVYKTAEEGEKKPYSATSSIKITLKRPFAKLRVVTTDMNELMSVVPTTAKVSYTTKHFNAFNALTGVVSGEKVVEHEYTIAQYTNDATGSKTLFTDYFFAESEEDVVQFTLSVYEDAEMEKLIRTTYFNTDIPVKRNFLTTITGNVLTDGNNINVKIEDKFTDPGIVVEYVEVSTAADLQEAINNADENTTITLGGDIDLGELFGASTLSTRATAAPLPIVIAEGKKVVLDLNGHKITTPYVEGSTTNHTYAFENHGSLTIQDSKGTGQIIARGIFNYGTMTLESGIIDACDGNGGYGVRNYDGATFVMNGGSIVTSNEDDNQVNNGGSDATTLRVDEGATATINGGTINNICDYTFAIENYGTTTVEGGTITSVHSTVSTYGTMTINGGTFTCDGIEGITAHALVAWGGSETTINGGTFDGKDNYNGFNVDASEGAVVNINGGKFLRVHSGSLYGKGTIIVKGGTFFDQIAESRIDSDFKLEKDGDNWTVKRKDDVAKIGEVGYTSLIKAVTAVEDGGTITLVADETFTERNRTLNSGSWYDGLYYVGDKSFTIDLGGFTVSQNGAVNDYLLNFKNDGAKGNTITLKNGTLDAGTSAYCALATSSSNAQKITINLESVNLVGNNSNGAVAKIRGGAELNVNAGTVITGKNNYVGIEAVGNNTVVNIYEGAKIYQNGTDSYVGAIVGASYNATMNIYGGYGKSAKCGIIVMTTGATINVSGGEWIANNDGTVAAGNNAVLVSQNNRYETGWACKSILNVTGGTFKGGYDCWGMGPGVEPNDAQINIKGGNFNADPAAYVVEGYKVDENNGIYTVAVAPAAKIGETEYNTLQEAFNAGGEITLLRNVTVAETVTLAEGKTAVLDLNGKTISGTMHKNDGAVIKNEGTLTVKNGTVKSTANNGGSAIANYGTLTIDNATINGAPREGESWPAYPINNYSNATVTNSIVTGYQGCLALNKAGETTISNCNFTKNYEKTSSHVFYVNHADAKVIINGGTYNHNGNDGSLAYINKGEVTINDGTFNAKDGGYGVAVLSGGKVTVNGGTLPAFLNWGGQIIDNRTK